MAHDPRVDAYIAKAAPFAQPVLTHVRALVHRVLPEAEEGIKWGMPAFMVGGKNVAGMAAFKAHCAVMIHGDGRQETDGMGSYGKVASLADLPGDTVLAERLRYAMGRIDRGEKEAWRQQPPKSKATISVPQDFSAALAANPEVITSPLEMVENGR